MRLLDPAGAAGLLYEAEALGGAATTMFVQHPPPDDAPNGSPDRWLETAGGGPWLNAFYRSPAVPGVLEELTGLPWETTGERGSYSYYRRPGHHLGLHRDIETCELAVITCLRDDGPAGGTGGVLVLYPGRSGEPLGRIRQTPEAGAVKVRLSAGESILLLGGLVPHRLLPVAAGQTRIIAPLCYRVVRSAVA